MMFKAVLIEKPSFKIDFTYKPNNDNFNDG